MQKGGEEEKKGEEPTKGKGVGRERQCVSESLKTLSKSSFFSFVVEVGSAGASA